MPSRYRIAFPSSNRIDGTINPSKNSRSGMSNARQETAMLCYESIHLAVGGAVTPNRVPPKVISLHTGIFNS